MTPPSPVSRASDRAVAEVDLDAVAANVARLRAHAGRRDLMAVVKADGYGHGIVESARAARAGGASWLGVALLDEALQLRAAGDTGPILSWLAVPGEAYGDAIQADVEVSAYSAWQLAEIVSHAEDRGACARVQLKVDSGLGRGGALPDHWQRMVDQAATAQRAGRVRVTGVWSHLACSDEPGHPSIAEQTAAYADALAYAESAGLEPAHQHLANSGGTLASPATWYSMVRPGIAIYGVSPFVDGSAPVDLTPAMTLSATVALVKRAPAGLGVSYGHTYTTKRETRLALIPLGYGDGVPRHASGKGPVQVGAERYAIAGRVCMDQFVLDVGDAGLANRAAGVQTGDRAVLFGRADRGEPTAHDWAVAADTIGYEIVTRIGSRVPRTYVGELAR